MQAYDSATLGARLSELAEVFDKKPVSEKGLTVWFNVLREFPTERVCGVLIGWPKTHSKFPTPHDVWKVCNEISIEEREAKARAEARENSSKEFHPGVSGEMAGKFIAEMRKILNRPKWTPQQHWERVLENSEPGSIGRRYAEEVLMKRGALSRSDREPGQDDEELAA